jgi:hypothetical protein
MDYMKKHPKTLAAIGLGVVIVIIVAVMSFQSKSTVSTAAATQITSPYAKITIELPVNTGLEGDANAAATSGQYEVFGLGQLPLTPELSYEIHEHLPAEIAKTIHPTYAHTYVHIDRDTLKCEIDFDCQFSFYLDSPEGYYHYHRTLADDGSISTEVRQQPFPEVKK